ncbi:hypothetical protein [Hyalangium rubrum]|uniref:Lipoprotein n=1 Tax=Hyalangium rubrum TaxID=3103134 RepID=A0ABU5H1X9_9BACT|nr:hypothetical protein [Hyalangium sp. s54d21]MDY7227400.1 hypothetical protein [Hyalangium sp. s54d21]
MMLRRLALLAIPAFVVGVSCLKDPVYPGDQVLGTFRFSATVDRQRTTCDLRSPDFAVLGDGGTFGFDGTFSRDGDAGSGYFIVQDFPRDAGYEGQRVTSFHRATVQLASCGANCTGTAVEETLDVILLSDSQDTLIGRRCTGLVDGGVPGDGGTPPGPTPNGYDVQRACGTLTDEYIPGTGSCTCTQRCRAVYTVEGTRVN